MRLKGSLSLTRRLTFLVTLASSAGLLSLGFVITRSVERHFEDLDMIGLVGKMDLIAQAVNELKTSDDLNRLALLMGHSLVGHLGLEVLVIDPANQTLFATAQVAADPVFSSRLLLANASRYPEQPLQPHREPVDLAAEVQALFDFYDALAEEKQLKLSLQGQAQVLADRLMLRRAIGNLLSNAIRHAQRDSCIRVTLQDQASEAMVTVENVEDTIPAEFLERIFDRFFRADPARQRGEGTGLGLAIAKSVVVAHGGTIKATSSDATTRFIVGLPHAPGSV